MPRPGIATLAAGLLLACASAPGPEAGKPPDSSGGADHEGGGGRPADGAFPKPEALENLRDQPRPSDLLALGVRDVASWQLTGPFPERVAAEPWADDTPAAAILAEVARQRPGLVVATRAMHCVAREIGLFFLAEGGRPPENLRRYMRARCHASASDVGMGYLEGRVPADASDAEVLEKWREQAEATIQQQLAGGARTVGIWLGRRGERALLVVVTGVRNLHVEPVSTLPGPDGRVVVEGEALVPVQGMEAIVTRGRLRFGRCDRDPELELPRFRFSCRVEPDDRSAWLAVSLLPPERLLSHAAIELLLWPQGAPDHVYRRPSYAASRQAWDGSTASAGFVELLNEVRAQAGLERLALDAEQSEAAEQLAPYFFEAQFGRAARSVADLVVMGLLAGWSVDGIVQSGHFTASWIANSNDVGRLLSEALDRPSGRSALLADDVERIAVGPLLEVNDGAASMAVVVGTYALFSEETHAANARQVLELLKRARAQQGQRAPQNLEEVAELSMAAAGTVQAGANPQQALQQLLRASRETLQRSVQGWIVETRELEDIAFPDELLTNSSVAVAVGVSSYRPEGEAWGRYVVMIVASDPGRGV